ncbi:MAG: glycosyltransferase [Candidatus Omnitrophota bacterium]
MTVKRTIGVVIYANPDHYPPVINAVRLLAKEFKVLVICRNQDEPREEYPASATIARLGRRLTVRQKEEQNPFAKIAEFAWFVVCGIRLMQRAGCTVVYAYDMHGFCAGFIAARFFRKKPFIYHNLELTEEKNIKGLGSLIKRFEIAYVRHADKIIFPDADRARYFLQKVVVGKEPLIVMNTPLSIERLGPNKARDIAAAGGFGPDVKLVMYQGAISDGHALLEVVRSMEAWPQASALVLSGYAFEDFMGILNNEIKSRGFEKRVIRLPFMPYQHLFSYTAAACLGLALFKPRDINQRLVAGASNKIFEYLSLGVPVLTNDEPSFRAILDPSFAYFASPDSPQEIARAVTEAIDDTRGQRQKAPAARQAHLARFNYEEQFKPVLEYLRSLPW